ncbi:MAG: Alanine racemase [Candidatus Moranbacteria bacterium GW2011_GWE1_36_7]|nr:MAG: Alanine racemase [Candidatus Moranbacteria bacterium GW2011_GWD2_36_12]KKQ06994.1 MAG: Alanine racemase [Candidatus Moranbacteria bacterium GW2011_GWE2_36_40]KKQ15616.1 MAG: Alanine racemase [Candidatus Moranbacteria bacterium GW2011_GWE1_36_7]
MLSYIEISKENLLHNFALMKSLVKGDVKMVSVVKANAYGHGQNEVVDILDGVTDYFQVDDFRELEILRKITKKKILVLGYVAKDEMKKALEHEGILGVYDEKQILALDSISKELGRKAIVHVKIDAYLGRQGVMPEKVEEMVNCLKNCENIVVDGIYSHFANIEDTTDFSHAQKQINAFEVALKIFEKAGFDNLKTHMSASSGIMAWEKNEGVSKLVRPGLSLYGMWPSEDLRNKLENENFKLKPVMRWVSHIAQIKTVPKGYSIGYGLTFVTDEITKIAVIPQGYSDGFDRGLSNLGEVLIKKKRCRILGRVAMNMFVVDVSHLADVLNEDEVVLLGKQGNQEITAEEIAEKIDTINYEITTRVLALLPRIVR